MRIGTKKKPFYRVVAVDERAKRTGAYLELLGTYNPLTEPKEVKLEKERIDYWIKKGAQPSVGYLRIIGKAPQRPPRKPKKEKVLKEEKQTEESVKQEASVGEAESETEENTSGGPARCADGSPVETQVKPEVEGNTNPPEVNLEEKSDPEDKKDEGSA